jgi:hypothetical protein
MKFILLFLVYLFSLSMLSQTLIKGSWKIECGASTANFFKKSSSLNLRYISPRFKWFEEETEEENKKPEIYKNMRLMMELIYTPPLKVLCTGFNAQYRIVKYKRLNIEVYGGLKFFFITEPDFTIPNSRAGHKGDDWYMNLGLLAQFNLGIISPFADVGGDGIVTIGTEFNFHSVYKKPKRRYNLNTQTLK